jgi:uncharacterized protein
MLHGWDGSPEGGWFSWLREELKNRGYVVIAPQLPKADEPRIKNWLPTVKEAVGIPDEETYFVGHSMGNQAIVRYLESLPENVRVGGAIFVAGFLKRLTNLEDEEVVRDVADEWLKTPLDLEKVKTHLDKSIAIFSDNDPYVPLDNQDEFKNILGSKIVILPNKNHFSGDDGTFDLPIALDSLLEISK